MAPVAALVAPRTLDAHNAFLRDDSKYSVNGICANKQVVVSHNGVDANKQLKQLISQSSQQQQQHPGQDYLSRTATAAQQVVDGRREEDLNDSLLPGRGGNRVVSGITEQVQDLNGRRKVCWNDSHGNELVEVWEFQPRFDITGIKAEHLADAMPVKEAAERVKQILYNGETISRLRLIGGKAKLLVGHGLDHDLQCLMLEYPINLTRDTSKYPPLRKTGKTSHSLKYLTKTLLGYKIQNGHHDPCEDAIASMRLYKKMRSEVHEQKYGEGTAEPNKQNIFNSLRQSDLEKMTPQALLAISRPDYYCWCFNARLQSC